MTAKHLNIDLNVKNTDLGEGDHYKPEFLKLNPAHTVPTIDDNGFVLWESRAIMQYLCNKYAPDSTLYPKDPKKRAVVDRWLNFDVSHMASQRETLFAKMFTGADPPEDKINAYKNNLKLMDQLIGQNKYLAGNELTIADLSVLATTVVTTPLDLGGFDLTDYPNFKRWLFDLKSELPYYEEINHFEKDEIIAQLAKMKSFLLNHKQNQ